MFLKAIRLKFFTQNSASILQIKSLFDKDNTMNLQPRHTQILTILKNHKDGLSTADIFKISQTMAGNEIPKHQGTDTVSKLVYSLRGSHMITTHDAGKTKIHKLSPLGHEALLKSEDEFEMPPAPVLPKTKPEEKTVITQESTEINHETAVNQEKISDKEIELWENISNAINELCDHRESEKKGVFMLEEKLELLEEIASAKFIDEDRANYLRDIADDLRSAA